MKRLLLPLLAAIALPTAVNAEKIDKEITEFCLKATDFAGCVKTMSKETNIKKLFQMKKNLVMKNHYHSLNIIFVV